MDPTETLNIMRDELGQSIDDRLHAALNLQSWLAKGGFRPPTGATRHALVTDDEITETIRSLRRARAMIDASFTPAPVEAATQLRAIGLLAQAVAVDRTVILTAGEARAVLELCDEAMRHPSERIG